jgi:hypothetical protein
MLLLYGDEGQWFSKSEAEIAQAIEPYFAYTRMLREKGKLIDGYELNQSNSARCVTLVGAGKVWDGPFAETKEQLGGYYLLEVADMAEAIDLAKLCPQAKDGVIEVRPVIEHTV